MDVRRMPVSEIMRRDFVSCGAKERLDFADQVLRLGRFRHLPVLEDGKLVGIVSNRDVLAAALTRVLAFSPGERRSFLHAIDVEEVMTREVVSAGPETPLAEAVERMLERKIGCLPIVDAGGTVVGLVTESDLLRAAFLGAAGAQSSGA